MSRRALALGAVLVLALSGCKDPVPMRPAPAKTTEPPVIGDWHTPPSPDRSSS